MSSFSIKMVFNPSENEIAYGYTPLLDGYRVEGVPNFTLADANRRQTDRVVTTPDVPDGRYLLAIFDGSEGRQHYTWDFVTVHGSSTGADDSDEGDPWLLLAAAALVGALVSAFALRTRQARRGTS